MYDVHSLCKNTGTDFSQFPLAAAKLYFCWIVVFPRRKHSPEGQMCVLPSGHTRCALAASARFGGGLGPLSGLEMHRSTRLRLVGARSRPKCSTIRSETGQSVQRDSQSSLLDLPGRLFWSKLASVSSLRKTYLPCFHDKEPPCRTVDRIKHRVRSRTRFLCALAPTGAPKRRRRCP